MTILPVPTHLQLLGMLKCCPYDRSKSLQFGSLILHPLAQNKSDTEEKKISWTASILSGSQTQAWNGYFIKK